MSSHENFNALQPVLSAIPTAEVQSPNLPVSFAVQEAESLYCRAKQDVDELAAAGFEINKIDALDCASGALRWAESVWITHQNFQAAAREQWNLKSVEGFAQRDKLAHAFHFAYRDKPEVLALLRQIPSGHSNSDMIQDLMNLSAIGRANEDELDKIRFDKTQLDIAVETADLLGNVLGEVTTGPSMDSAYDMRNRAFTHLKLLVDEIREYGKYLFFKDKKKVRGYASTYFRRISRAAARAKAAQEQSEVKKAA